MLINETSDNWFTQAGKTFWAKLLYQKIFPVDGQTMQAKSSSQTANLPSVWPSLKPPNKSRCITKVDTKSSLHLLRPKSYKAPHPHMATSNCLIHNYIFLSWIIQSQSHIHYPAEVCTKYVLQSMDSQRFPRKRKHEDGIRSKLCYDWCSVYIYMYRTLYNN